MIIQDKKTNKIVYQEPFKFRETGDVTYSYKFNVTGEYLVTLMTKLNGDENYGHKPIVANFDLRVKEKGGLLGGLLPQFF